MACSTDCVCIPNDETRADGFIFMAISLIPSLILVYLAFRYCIKTIALNWSYKMETKYDNHHICYEYDRIKVRDMHGYMLKIRLIIKGYSLCSMLSLIYVAMTETSNFDKCSHIKGYWIHSSYLHIAVYILLFIVFIIFWIDATVISMLNYSEYSRSIGKQQKQHCSSIMCCYYIGCCCLWDKFAPCCGFLIKYVSFLFDVMICLAIGASWTVYNPLGDVYTYSEVTESGIYQDLVIIEHDCLCPLSANNFVILYLTICLGLCMIISFILDGPCACIDKCCETGKCHDLLDFIVVLCEYGGGYFFAAFLFILRCDELHKRWDAFEENSHFYLAHITFSDVFFILFCVATYLWMVFAIVKWCKRRFRHRKVEDDNKGGMNDMELTALTVDEDNEPIESGYL
eukprot:356685_1